MAGVKLVAKIVDGCPTADGCGVVLYTDAGEILPGQTGSSLTTTVGEPCTLTVTFAIIGDNIRLEPSGSIVQD